jgi:hypothetical protein
MLVRGFFFSLEKFRVSIEERRGWFKAVLIAGEGA